MSKSDASYEEIKDKHFQNTEVKKEYDKLKLKYAIVTALAKLAKNNKNVM